MGPCSSFSQQDFPLCTLLPAHSPQATPMSVARGQYLILCAKVPRPATCPRPFGTHSARPAPLGHHRPPRLCAFATPGYPTHVLVIALHPNSTSPASSSSSPWPCTAENGLSKHASRRRTLRYNSTRLCGIQSLPHRPPSRCSSSPPTRPPSTFATARPAAAYKSRARRCNSRTPSRPAFIDVSPDALTAVPPSSSAAARALIPPMQAGITALSPYRFPSSPFVPRTPPHPCSPSP
ncbi:hypothetical protein B0H12DRAFT_555495 [Mycena haematopus]|nr:hypothetical protein B0H12DRAFT_555495 [Mycena haematopus]